MEGGIWDIFWLEGTDRTLQWTGVRERRETFGYEQ